MLRRGGPLAAALATSAASLVALRAQDSVVPYTNDTAVHEEMVWAALRAIDAGHFPPATWFAYLNLGSPQFLHYQPLAAMLTALLAAVIGVGHSVALTTWLLVACWPLCVYGASRILGLSRGAAGAAAALSPFLSSATGVGYEQISYLFAGFGVWSQLFAMWTLPFAWACSWRAVEERRFVAPAALLVAMTAAFHFETGYLAFAGVVLCALVRPSRLRVRLARALVVLVGAFALDAWAIVPLIAQGKWAAINSFLQSGSEGVDANSYGARRVLSWLVDGDLFDWHHLVLITPLVGLGLVACVLGRLGTWRLRAVPVEVGRLLVALFVLSLLLFFGRPTLGPLLDLLPGSKDLFLRRFLAGVQLSGLLLAGIGAVELGRALVAGGAAWLEGRVVGARRARTLPTALVGGLVVVALAPAWIYSFDQANQNGLFISRQIAAAPDAAKVDSLVARVDSDGGGRVFAGDPSDTWGPSFTVGYVPVFKYLASLGVDEIGFTLRTASLMSDPEVAFDESNPADYTAFGIRWLLLPQGMATPVPASLVATAGAYSLFELPGNGYLQVVDTSGSVTASSADLYDFAASLLDALPTRVPRYPTVAYEGAAAARPTLPLGREPSTPAGSVLSEQNDLANGRVSATVEANRSAVVLLSASYDPGWQARVDGRPVATEMVAPALVGVGVGPGRHTVTLAYVGFPDYPQLFLVGLLALVALVVLEVLGRRSRRPRAEHR